MMGMQTGPLDDKINDVLTINITGHNDNPVHTIPQILTNNQIWNENEATNRNIRLTAQPMMSMDNFFINNSKYDESVINFKTKLNNVETWTITNQTMMAHPFHIHGNHFYVIAYNGEEPTENMKGRKDVVIIPPMNGSVKIITKYEDFIDEHMPYMYHCHILSHEDNGMMGQFLIEEKTTGINEEFESLFELKNTQTSLILQSKNAGVIDEISIMEIGGKIISTKRVLTKETEILTNNLPTGVYILNVQSNDKIFSKKVIITH